MKPHKFCPSEPDQCDGCETYPLERRYEGYWQEAADCGDLDDKEMQDWLGYLIDKAELLYGDTNNS